MSKSLEFRLALALTFGLALAITIIGAATSEAAKGGKYGLGRVALPEEVKAWDTDVRPDGQGLPKGQGKSSDGEKIYNEQCAACHGDFGEGKDRWPVLVGGKDTLNSDDPVKTVGSYWPYTSTIFDYVRRAMPFGNAQSLSANDTYALTAYLLYMNDIVDDEKFVLSDKNFASIRLPNEKNFTKDVRPDTPLATDQKPCMKNCKADVKIVGRARVLDVTPEAEKKKKSPVVQGDVVAGKRIYKRCAACHETEKTKNKIGPHLVNVVDRKAGIAEKFRYSKALLELAKSGLVWNFENLDKYLTKPKDFIKRGKMAFAGLPKPKDRADLISYLKSRAKTAK